MECVTIDTSDFSPPAKRAETVTKPAPETALKDVLAFAKDEITEEEKKEAKRLMILVQQAIYRQ